MHRVLVLGGGFGGIATAVALRDRLEPADEVVLVERRTTFVMGLRKNWAHVGAGTIGEGERPLAALADRGVHVRHGEISAIRPHAREVDVDGETLTADAVVVALGAERNPDGISGFREHAYNLYTVEDSPATARAIAGFEGGRIVVGIFGAPYPCPPAPYELALLLADQLDSTGTSGGVFVFTPQPRSLPILGQAGCDAFDGRLANAGVSYRPNTTVTAVEEGAVVATDTRIPFDLLLGVPPHRAPRLVVDAGLAEPGSWVKVDPRTLETRFSGVYAIGDVTAVPLANGMPLPKAGVFAQAEGEVVAARIADKLGGREPTATFDGKGLCFLETGGGEATMVHGDFFANPPDVQLADSSAAHLEAKHRFEEDRLTAWFGG